MVHGGDDGNLKDFGLPDEYIYEWDFEKLQTLDAGDGAKIPTLEQVFELFKGKIFVNVEVKGPRTETLKPKYNCDLVVNGVLSLAEKHNYFSKFLISSFNTDILEAAQTAKRSLSSEKMFDIIYLYNYKNLPLPEPEVYTSYGDGVNLSANHINDEVVANLKDKGMKIGVWVRAEDYTENEDFYKQMIDFKIDFICSDYPLRAMKVRDDYIK